ncbi:methyltransferase [Aurantimonas sp. MSK8Z-1]|uniref:class I SAM-dependent DNA methyltransferase n=1 Tax=Mangrovibrevibacter kandeliae TaxID=2968473 RepID=UPI00211780AD|nr:methyltransferase [Aurantimonas sp. MSK8Z-1]MCW4116956.1 methyltransferase [Aurantimonas sp. MSK8Z-1]
MAFSIHSSGDPTADRRADYAQMLAEAGDPAAAADLMRQALERAPAWAAGWFRLAEFASVAGLAAEAEGAWRTVLRLDAADRFGAELKLAQAGLAPLPDAAPAAFVAGLFDQYADRFDTALVETLAYRAPEAIFTALGELGHPAMRFAEALDLGCGTGLMGERLRKSVSHLAGIDLSAGMLAKAGAKGVYDRLSAGDVAVAEPGESGRYDLVTAVDVLIYLGDLAPVFRRVRQALTADGLFAFTVEAHGGPETFVLRDSLRFAHSRAGLEALAEREGFTVRVCRETVLRQDRGEDVEGFVVVLAPAPAETLPTLLPAFADATLLATPPALDEAPRSSLH